MSRFTYEPGARMPWGHRHPVQEEAYVVVAGSGRAKLDDKVVELSAWDAVRVAPAVIRSFEAGPEGIDMICIRGRKPKEATPSDSRISGTDRRNSSSRPSLPFVARSESEAAGLLSPAWVTSSGALGHRHTEPPLAHVS